MLFYKNGVITESRFKDLTAIQWLFHYLEIMKHLSYKAKNGSEFTVEVVKQVLEVLTNRLDFVAGVSATNPSVGKSILETLQTKQSQGDTTDSPVEEMSVEYFDENFYKFRDMLPNFNDGNLVIRDPKITSAVPRTDVSKYRKLDSSKLLGIIED